MPKYIVLGFTTVKVPFFLETEAEDQEEAGIIVRASVRERSGNKDEEIALVRIIDVGPGVTDVIMQPPEPKED